MESIGCWLFFASRRRHTISYGDWSSDVCSSDLEADRLCDRIAIVDHGKLVALDTPAALKASVPGSNVIEAQFLNAPGDWERRLQSLDGVTSVKHEGAGMYRVLTGNGSSTPTQLVEMAVQAGVDVKSLSVQNPTLDD